jgi:hypothetical protein
MCQWRHVCVVLFYLLFLERRFVFGRAACGTGLSQMSVKSRRTPEGFIFFSTGSTALPHS